MKPMSTTVCQRSIASLLIMSHVYLFCGCATISRGTSQTVTVITQPPGRIVSYEGRTVSHGETITVEKRFKAPQFNVGDVRHPVMIDLTYTTDSWLIADTALLLLGIVPGVIALGVDLGTGAWRHLDEEQVVTIPAQLAYKP